MRYLHLIGLFTLTVILFSCKQNSELEEAVVNDEKHEMIKERIEAYAPVEVSVDLSGLTENQRMMIQKLAEAGHIVDDIFWLQSASDAVNVRDSLKLYDDQYHKDLLKYVMLNYGPYDAIFGNERFVGEGPEVRPQGGGFYPTDMTKDEFEKYVEENPDLADDFKSLYTVIVREDNGELRAVPYNEYYTLTADLAMKLEEAANYADNPSFKKYLLLRAEALRTDYYYDSDLAWMELEGNDVDLVIGPIENYEDEMFNYKAAHEVVIMVKDPDATAELEMFKKEMNSFQNKLPVEDEYKSNEISEGNIIQVVNVVYFGGDCNKAIKTIAAALPNDPKVADAKGRKLSMYKNHMEAKFDKIVAPIGNALLVEELVPYVDRKAFTSFVTLHEVSHALGPKYVLGTDGSDIREALKERYSAIEECKADILSMYNHKHLLEVGIYDEEYVKKAQATFLAGLYRSIRFGMNSAHGRANLIQLNYLKEKGAIVKNEDGKFMIDDDKFFDSVGQLAELIIKTQADGDYDKAGEILDTYSVATDEIKAEIEKLSDIPRDIDTAYDF